MSTETGFWSTTQHFFVGIKIYEEWTDQKKKKKKRPNPFNAYHDVEKTNLERDWESTNRSVHLIRQPEPMPWVSLS